MKKAIGLILVVLSLFLLVSCNNGNKDEVANEIVHYYNEVWIPINDMKEKGLRGIPLELTKLEEKHKEEEAITLVEEEALPVLDKVLERLKSVDPENEKIKKLTNLQIQAEEFAKNTFKKIIVYYDDGDVSKQDLKQYNEEMREKYQDVLDYRNKLMNKYNLEKVESEDYEESEFYKLKRADD